MRNVSQPRWPSHSARVFGVAGLVLSLVAIGLLLLALNYSTAGKPDPYGYAEFYPVMPLVFIALGSLLALRATQNPIGWLFCGIALVSAVNFVSREYAVYGLLTDEGYLPGARLAAWVYNWIWVPLLGLSSIPLVYLFPTGRPLSRKWGRAALAGGVGTLVATIALAIEPGSLEVFPGVSNPLGILSIETATDIVFGLALAVMVVSAGLGVISLFIRYRGSAEDERHQIKWFLAAAALVAVSFSLQVTADLGVPAKPVETALLVSLLTIPLATGVAILRYRLYDIDILINRTLVYVPLTAILAGVFMAMTGLIREAFTGLTQTGSDASIAFSTLVVVTLLTPLKNGLQALVDTHFKESPNPIHELDALAKRARAVVEIVDAEEFVRVSLEKMRTAVGSTGAAFFESEHAVTPKFVVGELPSSPVLTLSLDGDGACLGVMVLGPRLQGRAYGPAERQVLQNLADVAARILWLQHAPGKRSLRVRQPR